MSSHSSVLSLHEQQLEACLKNLFVVPTSNIESAFEIILGLIKEQSSQIDGLKRAHAEVLEDNASFRASVQTTVDGIAREKDKLSSDYQSLKRKHDGLLQSYEDSTKTVDWLKLQIETLTFNFLGEDGDGDRINEEMNGEDADADADAETHTSDDTAASGEEVSGGGGSELCSNTLLTEGCQEAGSADNTQRDSEPNIDDTNVSRRGTKRLTVDNTVAARLGRLELSSSDFLEDLSRLKQQMKERTSGTEPIDTKPRDDMLEEISQRIDAVETILHGFEQWQLREVGIHPSDEPQVEIQRDKPGEEMNAVDEGHERMEQDLPAETNALDGGEVLIDDSDNKSVSESIAGVDSQCQLIRRGSLLHYLDERDARNGSTIGELVEQIKALQDQVNGSHEMGGDIDDRQEINKQISQLKDEIQKQVDELAVSVGSKVSTEEFEAKIKDICTNSGIGNARTADAAVTSATTNFHVRESQSDDDGVEALKSHILEQIAKLDSTKADKDDFEQQLQQMEDNLKSLLSQEISKQQQYVTVNTEKTEDDLAEMRSIIDAQNDTISYLQEETPIRSDAYSSSMKEDEVNDRIQQATDSLRITLEDRLKELKSIEGEMDGFASKLAEKPSQDQIDAMLCDLEKRLGQDDALQTILSNMKTELTKRLTRGEVLALVKQALKDARLGIQNTKDTLMIGTTAYCLGCSQQFPAGVNSARAGKRNHDALPPAMGLVSNATLYGAGNRRNTTRPLQTLRSSPQRLRPKSAILGKFSASSISVRPSSYFRDRHHNSR